MKKIQVSATCNVKSKEIIKNSKYTYGDCINYMARVITSETTRLQNEIKDSKIRIEELKNQKQKIKYQIIAEESYLEEKLQEWESMKGEPIENSDNNKESNKNQQLSESINAIKRIISVYNCDPMEINEYTSLDTIEFHAKNCGMTKYEFEEILKDKSIWDNIPISSYDSTKVPPKQDHTS
ncbi:hypothetical protein [Methanobacterium alcaliphilum]|uniref:hypothetical protein n=1 Tax=Methanobacterium alcaliphilum TaxID=392018 RepID=UPI00200A0348|nr:hypothetical protein [Methanobacterium alcaliphilum]MCK9150489.1 hypothetical protein [Methanobacterium alcaliphilum]